MSGPDTDTSPSFSLAYLTEGENYILNKPANFCVDPDVHNLIVRNLLVKLSEERRIRQSYEKSIIPLGNVVQ